MVTPGGRLFRKYVIVFAALVAGALLTSGAIEVYFSYAENKAALIAIQRVEARSAAARIEAFINEIERQVGWATQPQLVTTTEALEQRRVDFGRLLRQVPAITELRYLDASGREQLRVSQLLMDAIGSGADFSQDPKFRMAQRGRPYVGPVGFHEESEPYMTVAMRTGDDSGVVVAERCRATASCAWRPGWTTTSRSPSESRIWSPHSRAASGVRRRALAVTRPPTPARHRRLRPSTGRCSSGSRPPWAASFVAELIDTFIEDGRELIVALRRALAATDLETFRRAAHSLKSNGETLGALGLASRARELEAMAPGREPRRGPSPGRAARRGVRSRCPRTRRAPTWPQRVAFTPATSSWSTTTG